MNALLKDLVMAGVKWELAENSVGFSEILAHQSSVPTRTRTSTVVPPISPVLPVSLDTANAMAARPTTLDALNRMILEYNHPLRGGASNVVLPQLAKKPAGIVIVTDIPSSDDDASGQILSGPAGELLDRMLGAIGLSRDAVFITPLLFWRTPGGRTPSRTEIDLARPFVDRFIELVEPRVIITLGTVAAAEVAHTDLLHNHGTVVDLPNGVHVLPIYHPNYMILKPATKRDVWTALQNAENLLKNVKNCL